MIFFKTRKEMRNLASKTGRVAVDNGASAPQGRRWAVKVF